MANSESSKEKYVKAKNFPTSGGRLYVDGDIARVIREYVEPASEWAGSPEIPIIVAVNPKWPMPLHLQPHQYDIVPEPESKLPVSTEEAHPATVVIPAKDVMFMSEGYLQSLLDQGKVLACPLPSPAPESVNIVEDDLPSHAQPQASAKERVLDVYPESHIQQRLSGQYDCIDCKLSTRMAIGCGNTEADAWQDALERTGIEGTVVTLCSEHGFRNCSICGEDSKIPLSQSDGFREWLNKNSEGMEGEDDAEVLMHVAWRAGLIYSLGTPYLEPICTCGKPISKCSRLHDEHPHPQAPGGKCESCGSTDLKESVGGELPPPAHKWKMQRMGGNPANAESYEMVRFCEVCGIEDTCEDPLPPCESAPLLEAEKSL